MRATFRIAMPHYSRADMSDPAVPLLPVLRRPARGAPAEGRRPRSAGLRRLRLRLYLDPKVAVGTIIRTGDERLVLVRRAIEPGYGLWVFPGGYVDRGEEIIEAALREAREESGLDVRIDGLVNIYSYAGTRADHHRLRRDGARRRAVRRRRVPRGGAVRGATRSRGTQLAFRSTTEALRDYFGRNGRARDRSQS